MDAIRTQRSSRIRNNMRVCGQRMSVCTSVFRCTKRIYKIQNHQIVLNILRIICGERLTDKQQTAQLITGSLGITK